MKNPELNRCPQLIVAQFGQEPLFTCKKGHSLTVKGKMGEKVLQSPWNPCPLLRRTSEVTGKPLNTVNCFSVIPEPTSPNVIQ
jgi:hypothetical protein